MNELLEKIKLLENNLDELDEVKRIRKLNTLIGKDKDLIKQIEEYQKTNDIKIKEEIYKNELFREYKMLENEINLMILGINNKLKTINNKGCDKLENN